jgi:hypothetical protein
MKVPDPYPFCVCSIRTKLNQGPVILSVFENYDGFNVYIRSPRVSEEYLKLFFKKLEGQFPTLPQAVWEVKAIIGGWNFKTKHAFHLRLDTFTRLLHDLLQEDEDETQQQHWVQLNIESPSKELVEDAFYVDALKMIGIGSIMQCSAYIGKLCAIRRRRVNLFPPHRGYKQIIQFPSSGVWDVPQFNNFKKAALEHSRGYTTRNKLVKVTQQLFDDNDFSEI